MKNIGLIMASAMISGSIAYGANIAYTGGAGSHIEDGANWTGGVIPAQGTDVGTITDTTVQFLVQDRMAINFNGTTVLTNGTDKGFILNHSTWIFNGSSSFSNKGTGGSDQSFGVREATFEWNSSGTLTGARSLTLDKNTSKFIQTDGVVNIGGSIKIAAGGELRVTGGTFDVSGSYGLINLFKGTLTLNGGAINTSRDIYFKDAGSKFEILSGTLTTENIDLINDGSKFDLLGGTVNMKDFIVRDGDANISVGFLTYHEMDFKTDDDYSNNGIITDTGFGVANWEALIANKTILVDGKTAVASMFNITDDTIQVIPEPTVLSLIVALGGAMLFIKRKLIV